MSIKTKEFDAFGVEYRTKQFAAAHALAIMEDFSKMNPCDILSSTEVLFDDKWHILSKPKNINKFVVDRANALPPRIVLDGIINVVYLFNFGFLGGWKSVKVPRRFTEGAKSIKSENVDPLISQLIQDNVASLRELEEYYSLEDAFRMFDVLMVKGVNSALASEAAMKQSKKG